MRLLLLWCAATIVTWAQPGNGVIAGRVTDPSGAVVPGALVRLEGGREHRSALTGAQGSFRFTVPAGVYRLRVEARGFETQTRERLVVGAGEAVAADIGLAMEGTTQSLTVSAKAPELEGFPEAGARNWRETLDMREVRESPAKDVGEALARVEGLWKIRKGGIANDVVLRGFQQDNLNVLVDGVRIYGACPNNMDPAAFHVDFAEIERVEVIKGAFDSLHQGSLGGLVNIVSRRPRAGWNFRPGLAAGSFGYYNPSLAGSYSRESLEFSGGYSFRRSLAFRDGAGKRFTEYANYRDPSAGQEAFSIGTAWFRTGFAPRPGHRGEIAYTRQNGGTVLYPYLQMDALYDNADRLSSHYRTRILRAEAYFTRVRHWMTDEFRLTSVGAARPFGMGTFAATRALGGKLEAERGGLVAGVESYYRNWNTTTTLRLSGQYVDQSSLPNAGTTVAGAFAQYRRALLPSLLLTAGARLDTAATSAKPSALDLDLYQAYKSTRENSRRDTNPSGNVMLAWRLPRNLELFAGAGHSVRVPDPQERYFALKRMGSDWVGNPLLRPTRNTEADFGVNYRHRRFTLRPTVFLSSLGDYITVHTQARVNAVPGIGNTAARSFENVDATIRGAELNWSVSLARWLLLNGGASYARGTKAARPDAGILDRNLAEMPPFKSRAALRYGNKRLFAEFETMAVRAQSRVDTDLKEPSTPGYALVSVRGGFHSRRLNLAAGIENLLDRFYYEHFSFQRDAFRAATRVPEPGRSLFLTAWVEF
jgi:iron complex outermembrane recepter protein